MGEEHSELVVLREPDQFCLPCGLHKLCKSPIMEGEGPDDAIFVFVGEAPGAEEDEEGKPFQGRSGLLLREEIEREGISISKCRFTNSVRCSMPNNDLTKYPKAIDYCRPHLLRELHVLHKAKVVILLGNTATESVLHRKGITKLNGEVFRANDRYYVASVHPAYILRSPEKIGMLRSALRVAHRLGMQKKSEKKPSYLYVRDKKMLYEFTDLLKKQEELATDIEGSTLSPYDVSVKPRIGCVGWCWEPGCAICYPVHARVGVKILVSIGEVLEAIKEVWESLVKHILHFGKYDTTYSEVTEGILLRRYWFDTGLASYALDERKGIHDLKGWAFRLGMSDYSLEKREFERDHPEASPSMGGDGCLVPGEILYPYNMGDCDATLRLKRRLYPELLKDGLYKKPFRFPIMAHNWTASRLEITGMQLDMDYNGVLLQKFPDEIEKLDSKIRGHEAYKSLEAFRLKQLVKEIYSRVQSYKRCPPDIEKKARELVEAKLQRMKEKDEPLVSLSSPDDKVDLLYKYGGYKPRWVTKKKGRPSVEMEVLEKMYAARPRPILQLTMDRSKYFSGFSKYIKPIASWRGSDGRVHTDYLVHGQVTGRVASKDPNLENLPARGDPKLIKDILTQFTATNDEYVILYSDEKQTEMRLFCDRADDDMMRAEFAAGKDPHRMGAAAGLGIPEEEVTTEQRRDAKSAISFGLLYGRGEEALAEDMGWSLDFAHKFKKKYFAKYDDCYKYRFEVEEFVRKHGYVVSYFGRRRRLGDKKARTGIYSDEPGIYNEALRQAINSPIQGDASDITWAAGYRLERWLIRKRFKSRCVGVVHDSLAVDTYRKELQDVMEMKYKFMTDRYFFKKMVGHWFSVPLDIDMKVGPDMGHLMEMKRLGKGFNFELPRELAA